MSYHLKFYEYLKLHNKSSFTHKDILRVTPANCCYRVFQDLKSYLEKLGYVIYETWDKISSKETDPVTGQKRTVTKRYKRYLIEKG